MRSDTHRSARRDSVAGTTPLLALLLAILAVLASPPVYSQAEGAQELPPDELEITADAVEMDMARRVGVFTGDVVVLDRNMKVTSATLTLQFDEEKDLKRAIFEGGVRIVQRSEGRWATSERADYDVPKETIVLTGNPVLQQGGGILRNADKVIYRRDTGYFKTEGGRVKLIVPMKPGDDNALP